MTSGPSITIRLNGDSMPVPAGTTVRKLLDLLGLDPARLAIEWNRTILRKAVWDSHVLDDGDAVEIVEFVGGG